MIVSQNSVHFHCHEDTCHPCDMFLYYMWRVWLIDVFLLGFGQQLICMFLKDPFTGDFNLFRISPTFKCAMVAIG